MKPCSTALAAYLASRPTSIIAPNCYTITFTNGTVIQVTDADTPVQTSMIAGQSVSPVTFAANGIRISGLKLSLKMGVDVDEQEITIASNSNNSAEFINGQPFLQALVAGVADGCLIQRDRAFLTNGWFAPALDTITYFLGRISTVTKIGRTEATVKVKSELVLLDIDYPRNLYSVQCRFVLYDAEEFANFGTRTGCKLNPNQTPWQQSGTVGSSPSTTVIPWSGGVPGASGNYGLGTITFTSGALDDISAAVGFSDGANLYLVRPLGQPPAPGDTFTANWGCDHTLGNQGCAKFNNQANHGGFPNVPPPSTGL